MSTATTSRDSSIRDSFTYPLQLTDMTQAYIHISIHIHLSTVSRADVYSLIHMPLRASESVNTGQYIYIYIYQYTRYIYISVSRYIYIKPCVYSLAHSLARTHTHTHIGEGVALDICMSRYISILIYHMSAVYSSITCLQYTHMQ